MRDLVQNGHADLPLEVIGIVAELVLERPAVDRDARRQIFGLLEQAEEIRILRVLVLDDDGDVLELGGDVRRKRVERAAYRLVE